MTFNFVYITTSGVEEARKIGLALVEEKLAACVNILPQMESIYHWQGKLEQSQEAVLIAKTDSNTLEMLSRRVKELHSYSMPCIAIVPVKSGNDDYFKWLHEQLEN